MQTLRLKRGVEEALDQITPVEGEPVWSTDTKDLRVGDGSTPGGVPVASRAFVEDALAARRYVHQQHHPEAVWSITHNLGIRPHVACTGPLGSTLVGFVNHINENELTVSFGGPISGAADLS